MRYYDIRQIIRRALKGAEPLRESGVRISKFELQMARDPEQLFRYAKAKVLRNFADALEPYIEKVSDPVDGNEVLTLRLYVLTFDQLRTLVEAIYNEGHGRGLEAVAHPDEDDWGLR